MNRELLQAFCPLHSLKEFCFICLSASESVLAVITASFPKEQYRNYRQYARDNTARRSPSDRTLVSEWARKRNFCDVPLEQVRFVSLSELGNDAYPQKTRKSLHVFTSYISYF
ncbi:hypothetical protein SS17_7049 (plasmid) [Escherichia coli O157:H7 str. SS17]|nr:hypothetical protein SS17_7049 [Escherichia coli O157:H7 str. SS17]